MTRQFTALCIVVSCSCATSSSQNVLQEADRALRARDTVLALTVLKQATQERAQRVPAEAMLGRIAFAQRRYMDAAAHFTTVLEAKADDLEARQRRGEARAALGDTLSALTDFRQAAGLSSHDPGILFSYGRALLVADSVDRAIYVLSTAKIYGPKNPEIFEALGDAFWRLPVPPTAIRHYQESLKLKPKNVHVQMKLAQIFLDQRRYTEAVKAFAAAHAIDSTYADAYLEEGRIYVRARLYARAVEPLRTFSRLRPGIAEADSLLIEALSGAKNYSAAARRSRGYLNRDSSSITIWRLYAYALQETGKYADATAAFATLGRLTSLSAEDYLRLGKAYGGEGKEEESIAAYLDAVRRDSSLSDPYNQLGILYMKRRDYARAAEMFERYITGEGSRSISAHLNAGACYLATTPGSTQRDSLLARARLHLLAARDFNPDNLTIRFRLAQYYVLADSFELAQLQYREVLDLAARTPGSHKREIGEAWAQIALGHSFKKEYREALACFPKATAAGYENTNLYLQWGLAVLQTVGHNGSVDESRKNVEEASRLFQKAIALDAANPQAHFWLGESLIRRRIEGENALNKKLTEEACREFARAMALDPSFEDAKKEMFRYGCK